VWRTLALDLCTRWWGSSKTVDDRGDDGDGDRLAAAADNFSDM
jgi:hypothetical protein